MELGRDSDTGGQVLLLLPFVASIFVNLIFAFNI